LQIAKSQRYRFSLLVNELRSDAGVTSYLTSVLAFINCLIVSHDSINDRVRIRNELIGKRPRLRVKLERKMKLRLGFTGRVHVP